MMKEFWISPSGLAVSEFFDQSIEVPPGVPTPTAAQVRDEIHAANLQLITEWLDKPYRRFVRAGVHNDLDRHCLSETDRMQASSCGGGFIRPLINGETLGNRGAEYMAVMLSPAGLLIKRPVSLQELLASQL